MLLTAVGKMLYVSKRQKKTSLAVLSTVLRRTGGMEGSVTLPLLVKESS